jgi:pimeloyl-ACP methyl ester carboxylesterase
MPSSNSGRAQPSAHNRAIQELNICLVLTLMLAGCVGSNDRAMQMARRHGLTEAVVDGTRYRHRIFYNLDSDHVVLFVFIDGDGSPWTRDGAEPARDPTPRRPLALELGMRTPRSILYLGRPCYFSVQSGADCAAPLWTSDRYSKDIVESMAAVANHFAADHGYQRTVLVGYSGGGTLAVLMARYISSASAVVTIAADLDVEAWARWHDYLPLAGSLNPATQAPLAGSIRQLHLVGGRDLNVPETVNQRFLVALRPDEVWRFPAFDHICCWVEQWSSILPGIDARISAADR